jgi:hypothetical protein
MTGYAQFLLWLYKKVWVLRRMWQVALEAAADRSGTMQEVALRETCMAMGAQGIRRYHEAGVSILVMAVIAALFGIGRVLGFLDGTLLFQLGRQLILCGLNVIVLAVLLRRRHAGNSVENSACDLMHSQRVTTATNDNRRGYKGDEYDFSHCFP